LSKKCQKIVKKVQKAQLAKLPHSIHHKKRDFLSRFYYITKH
jgi:hypothetical protein